MYLWIAKILCGGGMFTLILFIILFSLALLPTQKGKTNIIVGGEFLIPIACFIGAAVCKYLFIS